MLCGLFRLQARQYFLIQQDGLTNKKSQQRLTVICCVVCSKTMNFKSDNVGSGNFKNFQNISFKLCWKLFKPFLKPMQNQNNYFKLTLWILPISKQKFCTGNRFGLDNLEIRKTSATQIGQPRKDMETKCSCYETNWWPDYVANSLTIE